MNKKSLLFWILLLISLFSSSVIAAEESAFRLADIVKTIQGFNIGEAYNAAPYVIDGILYLILFIGVAQVTLGKRFKGRGGKAVITAIGLILAFSLSVWSMKTGFMLARLGALAGLIFVIIIAMFIFRLVKGKKKAGAGTWMAILVIYISMYVFFPELIGFLSANKWGRLGLAILNVMGIIAIPMVIVWLFKLGRGEEEPDEVGRYRGLPGFGEDTEDEEARVRERGERREREAVRREERGEDEESIRLTKKEIRGIKDICTQLERVKRTLEEVISSGTTGATSLADFITNHNADINAIMEKLHGLINLDEKIKGHLKRIKKKHNLKIINDLLRQYKSVNIIEKMIDDSIGKLEKTINLPHLSHFFSSSSPPIPVSYTSATNESKIVSGVLTIIKHVYNRLVKLLRVEGIILNELS